MDCLLSSMYHEHNSDTIYIERELIMERNGVIVGDAILHILDGTVGMPVISEALLELGPDLYDFLGGHIFRIASSDDLKNCVFDEASPIYSYIKELNEENLVAVSAQIAESLYSIMNANIDIPSADLFVVTYKMDGASYLALLKMNYKTSYAHFTGSDDLGNFNDIIKQKATLPNESAKLSEAALICLDDMSLKIVEKKYEVNGVKANYFSEMFLQCHTSLSSKSKLSILTKAVDQINKKYYEHDLTKQLETKSVIHNEFNEQGSVHVQQIGEKLYQGDPEVQEEFEAKLEKYNLVTEEVKPQNKLTVKKFDKQFLTTDTGIEINIPMDLYNEKDKVEFLTNPDGTISILIKNVNQIKSK